MKKITIGAFLALGFYAGHSAAKIVSGKIENSAGKALSQVLIKVREVEQETRSDQQGQFQLDLPIGQYTLDVKGGRDDHFHQVIEVSAGSQPPILISLQQEPEHKIVIRMNPLEHTSLDMATPTLVLAGDELIMKRSGTLGDILQFEPGISMSSFGPAVSRPVIRGLSGSRVKITNNQMMVQDASTTSADHDSGVEPLLADQIEVVKGPATLIYGSGAIGGVVNVSDRKISPETANGLSGGIETRAADGATGERSLVFTLDNGGENWNWHIDGYSSETDDIRTPQGSESRVLHESEQTGEPFEADVNARLASSDSSKVGGSVGTTYSRDWGYVGAAVSRIKKEYGVPGHAPHEEETGEEEAEEESVSIDMSQTRYDLQAQIEQPFSGFERWFAGYALTDYQHSEIEGSPSEGFAVGTLFKNRAWELKSYLKHDDWQGWSGIWGVQINERDFAAIGEEAFVPPSITTNSALFVVEEKTYGDLKWEFGARFEQQRVAADNQVKVDNNGISASIGGVYTLSEHNKIAANFSRATRFASVEELFSEGAHIATRSYEIGNAGLDNETSNNFDLSYRFEVDGFDGSKISGELNGYLNRFDNFIYGANADAADPCVSAEALEHAEEDELLILCYQQQDADLKGLEFQLNWVVNPDSRHQWTLSAVADHISAELASGESIPRIPPAKRGLLVGYDFAAFSANLSWLDFKDRSRISANELPTKGFTLVDIELAYRLAVEADELFLFFKGSNLLDEDIRDHASFLKDLAPRPGRSFLLGARYSF